MLINIIGLGLICDIGLVGYGFGWSGFDIIVGLVSYLGLGSSMIVGLDWI